MSFQHPEVISVCLETAFCCFCVSVTVHSLGKYFHPDFKSSAINGDTLSNISSTFSLHQVFGFPWLTSVVFGILTTADSNTPAGCLARKRDLWKGNRGYKFGNLQGPVLFHCSPWTCVLFTELYLLCELLKNELHTGGVGATTYYIYYVWLKCLIWPSASEFWMFLMQKMRATEQSSDTHSENIPTAKVFLIGHSDMDTEEIWRISWYKLYRHTSACVVHTRGKTTAVFLCPTERWVFLMLIIPQCLVCFSVNQPGVI